MAFYSFDERRFQKSIRDIIVSIVGENVPVIWSMPNQPRPPRPYVVLDIVSEVETPDLFDVALYRFAPTDVLVVFDTVTDDKYYQLLVNGFLYEILSTPIDTVTTIRDYFFEQLDGKLPGVEVSKNDVDGLEFNVQEPGAIYSILAYPQDSITVEEFGSVYVEDTKGQRFYSVSIDCYSDDPKFYSGAWKIANNIRTQLQRNTINETLEYQQVSLLQKPSEVIDLSNVFGSQFESRAQFEILVNTPVFQSEPAEYIESIQFTFNKGE